MSRQLSRREFKNIFNEQKRINQQIVDRARLQVEQLGQDFKPKVFDDVVVLNKINSNIAEVRKIVYKDSSSDIPPDTISVFHLFNDILQTMNMNFVSPGTRNLIDTNLVVLLPYIQTMLINIFSKMKTNINEAKLSEYMYCASILVLIIDKIKNKSYNNTISLDNIKLTFYKLLKGEIPTNFFNMNTLMSIRKIIDNYLNDPNNKLKPLLEANAKTAIETPGIEESRVNDLNLNTEDTRVQNEDELTENEEDEENEDEENDYGMNNINEIPTHQLINILDDIDTRLYAQQLAPENNQVYRDLITSLMRQKQMVERELMQRQQQNNDEDEDEDPFNAFN